MPTNAVKGTVTYDGQAIKTGVIYFDNKDSTLPSYNATITEGAYSAAVVKGKYTVRIQASKLEPLPPGVVGASGEKEGLVQYLPAKYNEKTELSADVSGPAEFNFSLKSD